MNQILTVTDLTAKGADRHKVRGLLEHLTAAGLASKNKQDSKVVYVFDPQQAPVPAVLAALRPRKAESVHKLADKTDLPQQTVEASVTALLDKGLAVQPYHSRRFRLNV